MPVQIDLAKVRMILKMQVSFFKNMLSFWGLSCVFRVSTRNWNFFLENMHLRRDAFFLPKTTRSVWAAQLSVQEAMMYVK